MYSSNLEPTAASRRYQFGSAPSHPCEVAPGGYTGRHTQPTISRNARKNLLGGVVIFVLIVIFSWYMIGYNTQAAYTTSAETDPVSSDAHSDSPGSQIMLQHYSLIWDFGACSCTGWAQEIVSYLRGLFPQFMRGIGIVAEKTCFCPGLPEPVLDTLYTMIDQGQAFASDSRGRLESEGAMGIGGGGGASAGSTVTGEQTGAKECNALRSRPDGSCSVNFFISHKPPSRYPRWPYRGLITIEDRPDVVIGRSMAEVDQVPSAWAERINGGWVDELWVPSKAGVAPFVKAGVNRSMIHVIPEAIDTKRFGVDNGVRPFTEAEKPDLFPPPAPGNSGSRVFKFFSVFKMEPRKGWNILVRNFCQTFPSGQTPDSERADVHLYLQTYRYGGGSFFGDPRDPVMLKREVEQEVTGGSPDEQLDACLTHIHILSAKLTSAELSRLYVSMDAFVLPSHGEGWGLPYMEAMASGLPTIGTDWSGNTEFMTPDNSYLIEIEPELVSVPMYSNDFESWQKWAQPRGDSLRAHMLAVATHPQQARERGLRGQSHIRRHFNLRTVAAVVADRLAQIAEERGIEGNLCP